MNDTWREQVYAALMESDPQCKVAKTFALQLFIDKDISFGDNGSCTYEVTIPGRPLLPELVAPKQLLRRKPTTAEGRAVLIHSVVHIEFNAINLALDAAYRFRDLPAEFYRDWLTVAAEEAYHFTLLHSHLQKMGWKYGDFPAHNGLWEMAQKTAYDPLVRMALVPRVLEARGLDVSPAIQQKLIDNGDANAATLLEIILRDEVSHVAVGDRWFRYLCAQRQLDAESTFIDLLQQYMTSMPRPPFHREARLAAGFSEEELSYLEGIG